MNVPRRRLGALTTAVAVIALLAPASAAQARTAATPTVAPAAAAGTNAAPTVIPALQQWTGGTGSFDTAHVEVVYPAADAATLKSVADQTVADAKSVLGLTWTARAGNPDGGDIALKLDPTAYVGPADSTVAAKEGYRFDVTSTGVTITSRTSQGVFWGTRSALQSSVANDDKTIPVGSAVDWPNYAMRGYTFDIGRKWMEVKDINDYIRYASWFKMNTIQLHLNDNEIGSLRPPGVKWKDAYAGFRLVSTKFPGLTSTDGSISRAEWDGLEDNAAAHGVMIIPEIDAPSHALAFVHYRPSLGLNGGDSDHLDLSKPETTQFMKDIYTEFAPWFRSPIIHFGTDEYPSDLKADYKTYFNTMAAHIRTLGKQPEAWGSLSYMADSPEGFDKGVIMQAWNNGWYSAKQAIADGYDKVINSNDGSLYVVPFASYYHGGGLDGRYLFDGWQPYNFGGENDLPPTEKKLLGAMPAVWNDMFRQPYSNQDVFQLIEPTWGVLAQKMWRGAEPGVTYDQFMLRARVLKDAPGLTSLVSTLPGIPDPALNATSTNARTTPGGSSGTTTLTVKNTSSQTLTNITAAIAPSFMTGLTLTKPTGPTSLAAGATGTWTATATAAADAVIQSKTVVFSINGKFGTKTGATNALAKIQVVRKPPAGMTNVAYGSTVTASSVEGNAAKFDPANVVDGDPNTRWSSNNGNSEWITLKLPSTSTVSQAVVSWEPACAKSFKIQVSTNGSTWTDAATVDPSTCKVDTITLNSPNPVNYVRMQGVSKVMPDYGYSIYDFDVFGVQSGPVLTDQVVSSAPAVSVSPGTSTSVVVTGKNNSTSTFSAITATVSSQATGITVSGGTGPTSLAPGESGTWTFTLSAATTAELTRKATGNISLIGTLGSVSSESRGTFPLSIVRAAPAGTVNVSYGSTVTASSVEGDLPQFNPNNVVDGDMKTRWASEYTDGEWITLKLPKAAKVTNAVIAWEPACAAAYKIQVSNDGTTWTDAAVQNSSTCATDSVTLNSPNPVSYVRMQGVDRATGYGYSIYEFDVFGNYPADTSAPVVTLTPSEGPVLDTDWYNAPVTVTATATDNDDANPAIEVDSGAGFAPYTAPVEITAQGTTTVRGRATDDGGNVSAIAELPIKLDTVPPSTTATVDPVARTVTLTATDATSGVAGMIYTIDGGDQAIYDGPITVGSAETTVTFFGVDNASNSEAEQTTTVPAASDADIRPTDVVAVAAVASATISWKAPANTGGNPITRYDVVSAPGGKTCSTTGALTCKITGLTGGVSYTFAVTATNSAGTSAAVNSNPVTPRFQAGRINVSLQVSATSVCRNGLAVVRVTVINRDTIAATAQAQVGAIFSNRANLKPNASTVFVVPARDTSVEAGLATVTAWKTTTGKPKTTYQVAYPAATCG